MRRALLSVASTALSGLSNVIVQLVAAGLLAAAEFADFSIVAATVLLAVGSTRAVVAQTDMLRGNKETHRGPADAALLAALLLFALGVATSAVGLFAAIEAVGAAGIGLAVAPIFVLQDSARFRSFRVGRAGVALLSDATVLIVAVMLMVVLAPLGVSAPLLTLAWTGATALGLIVVVVPLRMVPRSPRVGARWLLTHRDLIGPASGEYFLQAALPYALNFVILSVGGADALAGYRLVQLIFASLGNVASGLNAATLPGLVESRSPKLALRTSHVELAALTALSGMTLAVLTFLPDSIGQTLFGQTWLVMVPFLLVGSIHGWVNSIAVPNYSLLRLLGYAQLSFWIRAVSVIVTVGASVGAVLLEDAVGVAWAIAVPACAAFMVRFAIGIVSLRRLISRGEPIP